MDDPELNDALEKLHQELDEVDDLDDESVQQLQHLESHIRTILERERPLLLMRTSRFSTRSAKASIATKSPIPASHLRCSMPWIF